MAEMDDFAKAIAVAKAYVDKHPDTLLVITADHETGGMSLGAAGEYLWLPEVVRKVKATGRKIAEQLKQWLIQSSHNPRVTHRDISR